MIEIYVLSVLLVATFLGLIIYVKKTKENAKQLADNEKQLADNERQLADNEKLLADNERQLADNKKQLVDNELQLIDYKARFTAVFNTEAECNALKSSLEKELIALKDRSLRELAALNESKQRVLKEKQDLAEKASKLLITYNSAKELHDSLNRQIAIYNNDIELIELGFYEPQFDFDTSQEFITVIATCRERQKALLKDKTASGAIYCSTQWTVDGSKVEGQKKTEKGIRLTARAFNNECEAAITGCTWRNAAKMRERIIKAYNDINKLNASNLIHITDAFLKEKLIELDLYHGFNEKKQREKEEQAEIRAQMREDAKVEAEIKKLEQESIREEQRYQKALDEAKKELGHASDSIKTKLQEKIDSLQAALEEAENKHQRAKSMAEQTKQGHVYIISNEGSFGENVYKIGMTRRLDPLDRVSELGDASVPFGFDIHAMIHTKDAPALEKALHEKFELKRINLVNRRKEFFCVTLDEIKAEVLNMVGNEVHFIETAVARDYNESKAIRNKHDLEQGRQAELSNVEVEHAKVVSRLSEAIYA